MAQLGSAETIVVVPTYNEALTISRLVAELGALPVGVDVLIVDDASPDGTGRLADELALQTGWVSVLHRPGKLGLGPAYRAGFAWALSRGYRTIAQMDADGSHHVEELPYLVKIADSGSVALGSRNVEGGRTVDWSRNRSRLSFMANRYARAALGVTISDVTSGFRAWPAAILEDINACSLRSRGFVFQIETLMWALRMGHTVEEYPITFSERLAGRSKMSVGVISEGLCKTAVWGLDLRLRSSRSPACGRVASALRNEAVTEALQVE